MQRQVRRLGPNSFGEELSPGQVTDCDLGLLVDQPLAATHPAPGRLLVVGPDILLDERVRQPGGRAVYDLLTGHPARTSRELVFLADLARALRTWQGTDVATQGSTSTGSLRRSCSSPAAVRSVPVGTTNSAPRTPKAPGRPAMDYARGELPERVAGWLAEQYLRWLHPTSRRRPGATFL